MIEILENYSKLKRIVREQAREGAEEREREMQLYKAGRENKKPWLSTTVYFD